VAVELKILCSNTAHALMSALVPLFERASSHRVVLDYASASIVAERIRRGETFDATVLAGPVMDKALATGAIARASLVAIARCGIGVAVRTGGRHPDISTVDAFKRALAAAKTVAYTEAGVSGMYFAGLIEKLGIAAAIKAKARTRRGGLIAELVASGEAEIAVQQIPELIPVKGIDIVGPLPPELQNITIISAGVFVKAQQPAAAVEFLRFLTTPETADIYRANGFDFGAV
jgi:molybdate transport system substrate-binding protein